MISIWHVIIYNIVLHVIHMTRYIVFTCQLEFLILHFDSGLGEYTNESTVYGSDFLEFRYMV
jgi:hypothetical protein